MNRTEVSPKHLASFLSDYRGARTPLPSQAWPARLAEFLDAYRKFGFVPAPVIAQRRKVDPVRLSEALVAMHVPLAQERAAGTLLNPWKLAGLRRNEVRNAAVLASFLSPRLTGTVAVAFLDALLDTLRPDALLPDRTELERGFHVRTEHYVAGGDRDRVDLTIEGGQFVLGLEIKIDAAEGVDQLTRYVETIARWGRQRGKRAAVLFLAPYPAGRDDVRSLDWRAVIAAARKVARPAKAGRTATQTLISQFADHIASF